MRAIFDESEFGQKRGAAEETQVEEGKMPVERIAINSPSSVVDVEKGEVYQTEAPALLENLITHGVEAHEQASHSKHMVGSEKIVATLLVVCFVVVEAYFVGVSFRDWLDRHHSGNSTTLVVVNHDVELVVPQFLGVYEAGADGGGQDQVTDADPYEDFEGGLSLKATRVISHKLKSASTERNGLYRENCT